MVFIIIIIVVIFTSGPSIDRDSLWVVMQVDDFQFKMVEFCCSFGHEGKYLHCSTICILTQYALDAKCVMSHGIVYVEASHLLNGLPKAWIFIHVEAMRNIIYTRSISKYGQATPLEGGVREIDAYRGYQRLNNNALLRSSPWVQCDGLEQIGWNIILKRDDHTCQQKFNCKYKDYSMGQIGWCDI